MKNRDFDEKALQVIYFRFLLENSKDVILILNRENFLIYESPSVERVLGCVSGERIGAKLTQYVHSEDHRALESVLQYVLRKPGASSEIELRIQHKDGSWRFMEATFRNLLEDEMIKGLMINARDITERKKAEEALSQEEGRFRRIAETASDAIITIDQESRIIFSNRAVERILGYSRNELMGQSLTLLMPPHLQSMHMNGMERYRQSGQRRLSWEAQEFPGVHKDGRIVSLEISLTEFSRGKENFFTAILRDVTERKRIEETMLKYERLGAIGEMAAGMAHEIRNPLAAISASAQYLSRKQAPDPSFSIQLQNILEQCERLARLVNDTLEYSRNRKAAVYQHFNAIEVFEDALKMAQVQFGPAHIKIRVILDFPEQRPTAHGDSVRIQQILVNLILNAYQEMLEGGVLLLRCFLDDKNIYFWVQDDAKGISDYNMKRIFEPFFTTKNTGSGLGLSISQKIAEDHRGKIEMERMKPRGTAFILKLPLIREEK